MADDGQRSFFVLATIGYFQVIFSGSISRRRWFTRNFFLQIPEFLNLNIKH